METIEGCVDFIVLRLHVTDQAGSQAIGSGALVKLECRGQEKLVARLLTDYCDGLRSSRGHLVHITKRKWKTKQKLRLSV